MNIKIEKITPRIRPHIIIKNEIFASSGYKILKSKDNGNTWDFCNELPVRDYKKIFSKNRIISRLSRLGISQIKKITNDKLLICSDKNMFLSDISLSNFEKIEIPIRSYQLLDNSICITSEYVYYGEYFPNSKKENVNIYRSKNGLDWEIIYTFPEKTIKHIHVLQFDPYTKKIWFSSGDVNDECILGFSDLDFTKLTVIGKGSQKWRTLEFIFEKNTVYWGMDSPIETSGLLSYDRESKKISKILDFDGPIYNIKKLRNGFLLATATERGKGELDNKAHLWFSSDILNWHDCLSYEKDILPNIFGFGRLLLCDNIKEKIIFSGQGLLDIDNKCVVCEIIPEDKNEDS